MAAWMEIISARQRLSALAPYTEALKSYKQKLDLVDAAFMDLRMNGSRLTREGVTRIVNGEMLGGVPVREHRLIGLHRDLSAACDRALGMQMSLDARLLGDFARILADNREKPPVRTGVKMLYHLDIVTVDASSISTQLTEFLKAAERADYGGDACLKAAVIHCGIVRIYPYEEPYSEMAARAAMQFELIRGGLFPTDPGLSESQYNKLTSEAVRKKDPSAFAEALRVSILSKLNHLTMLAETM